MGEGLGKEKRLIADWVVEKEADMLPIKEKGVKTVDSMVAYWLIMIGGFSFSRSVICTERQLPTKSNLQAVRFP